MSAVLNHRQWGDEFNLIPRFGNYENGRLAFRLVDNEMGEPFATITVNLPDAPLLADGEVYVKDWAENEEVVKNLVESGWLVPTGDSVQSGFVSAKVMRLAGELAAEEERQWKQRAIGQDIDAMAESMGPGVTVTRLSDDEVAAILRGEA